MTKAIFAAFAFTAAVLLAGPASAEKFKATLDGKSEVPPNASAGTGTADIDYDPASKMLSWKLTYSGLSGPATAAHFHGPAKQGQNAPVVIWLTSKTTPPSSPITGNATLTPQQAQQFLAGEWYVNVHTQSHPAGEIRGQVVPPKG